MTHADHPTKKEMILEIARELSVPRFTPAEVEQIRRQLMARLGAAGKTSPDYIAGVLETAGMRIVWSMFPTRTDWSRTFAMALPLGTPNRLVNGPSTCFNFSSTHIQLDTPI